MGDLDGLDTAFAFSAIVGGLLFLVRLALMLFGGDHDADHDGVDSADMGHDVSHADGPDHTDGGDSGDAFRLLSIHSLTAFLLVFGLIGLGLHRQLDLHPFLAAPGAFLAGLAAMALIASLFSFMHGMQSSGTLDMRNAVGQEGNVYLTVAASGSGQVEITIQGRRQTFNAVTDGEADLPTDSRVRVVRVVSGSTLVVEPA
ncbi:MAG: NfeD family protein [Planctomycetota bacterium]